MMNLSGVRNRNIAYLGVYVSYEKEDIYIVISGSVPVIDPSILFPLLSIGDPFFHLDKFHNQRGGQLAGGASCNCTADMILARR